GRRAPDLALELLLNETCPPRCPFRDAHYARLARETLGYVEGFQQLCNLDKFREPWLILAAPWIRPEDVVQYHRLGVRRFKIAGREMSRLWLERAVRAYVFGQYDGNLIDLFTMTPPGLDLPAANIVYLNNSSLNGFLADLRSFPGAADAVCKRWSSVLWERGDFRICDAAGKYRMELDGPRCIEPGSHMLRLMQLRPSARPDRPREIRHRPGSLLYTAERLRAV
ncbi:MAG: hypothetical protein ACPL7K_10120, partial [Armatimonadota bacterium]